MVVHSNGWCESNGTIFQTVMNRYFFMKSCHISVRLHCLSCNLFDITFKRTILMMKASESEHIRDRLYKMLRLRPKHEVVKHFKNEGIPKSTIYRTIKRFEDGFTAKRAPKIGRPPVLDNRSQQKLLLIATIISRTACPK